VGAEADFRICMEPLCVATQNNFLHTAAEVRQMAAEINLPNVGLILDTYSGLQEETDLPAAIRATGDRLFHYHCNDLNQRAPGWGDVDFVPLMRALLDIHFDGFCSIEVFDFSLDATEHARRGAQTLRAAIAAASG
jgi:D-psicose/D-tagatose/L-ribulose 3-epimerase